MLSGCLNLPNDEMNDVVLVEPSGSMQDEGGHAG